MDQLKILSDFIRSIGSDPRVGPVHIALYTVLFDNWVNNSFPSYLRIVSYEIMPLAKISSKVTYHKTIRELHTYGYLVYMPCFNRKGSRIRLVLNA